MRFFVFILFYCSLLLYKLINILLSYITKNINLFDIYSLASKNKLDNVSLTIK